MKLVIDANIPAADTCFGHLGDILRRPGREISAQDVSDADALIVRSVTQVDAALLQKSPVRFVGSCTIGVDHVDLDFLDELGIGFASAPGCNAEAVVDYVLASLLTLAEQGGWSLFERTVGIVGAGNVGGRLRARLKALGLAVLVCDPPRAEREGAEGFVALDELIERCDVLCLHTPLVREGEHATRHLLNAERLAALAPNTVLINAGRGDCVDGQALDERLTARGDLEAVLDVWESEPAIDAGLFERVALGTPHIAGHSLDGKLRGTFMIQQALTQTLNLPEGPSFSSLCPAPALRAVHLQGALPVEDALRLCMRAVYDVRRDRQALKRECRQRGAAAGFDDCRTNYPLRREFATLEVQLSGDARSLEAVLSGAGFNARCIE
ncbi:4-phosphoerythronate dehydrogenase PdxB [Halomonas sp. PAMB 3232]|uniref:4-phosphoerythronate dehydrogenase PdxB n=1 Tax=Halomonas sp. PAMB 3232 TaxID=3075221 RepID=UPI00289EF1CA|nr:4-phosphoerythronate dehydrogenase PdxB [Halomonas sp. PAMB 3232]WNL37954.1 4-phosphoerythronate dehydrogenase PdxB [Halomonas sp. PAMB 3232]